jgi:fructose/tagatose bisphosphate aldolase
LDNKKEIIFALESLKQANILVNDCIEVIVNSIKSDRTDISTQRLMEDIALAKYFINMLKRYGVVNEKEVTDILINLDVADGRD